MVRVITIATIDGRILFFLAGGFGVISALMLDGVGTAVGFLAAGAGALELQGVKQIKRRNADGVNRLVQSQLLVIVIVVTYARYKMGHFNPAQWERWITPEIRDRLDVLDITVKSALAQVRIVYVSLYGAVAILTLLFQGAMAGYYHRRRNVIRVAVAELPPDLPGVE